MLNRCFLMSFPDASNATESSRNSHFTYLPDASANMSFLERCTRIVGNSSPIPIESSKPSEIAKPNKFALNCKRFGRAAMNETDTSSCACVKLLGPHLTRFKLLLFQSLLQVTGTSTTRPAMMVEPGAPSHEPRCTDVTRSVPL